MPKKVTKEINIDVSNKDDQGFWILKENKRKGERAIKTKGNKVLVKRNRSGYDYNKTISGYEWTKAELDKKLAERAKQGMMEKKSILRDLTHTHRNTKTAPIVTASDIFDNDDWNQQDVLGVDTPPGMTLKEIVEGYRINDVKKKILSRTNLTEKELAKLVKEQRDKLGEFVTEFGAHNIVARNLGVDDDQLEKKPKKITDTATKREQELKAKIASGEIKLQERSAKEQLKDFGNVKIEKNIEDNRLRILFDDIPSVEIRSKLKSRGFRWSPKNKAWQKMISNQADYESKEIVEEYNQEVKKKITPETKPKEKIDRSKSIAAGKNLYQEKYSPGRTHLAKTKTMTDMQKRRLIKACIDNEVDTRELDPSLKYDENQEIIQDMIETNVSQFHDDSKAVDKKIAKLQNIYYDDFGKERIKEREIDGKTTEEKVITKEDLSRKRKKTQLDHWKKEPYKSKVDVEEIDTAATFQTD